MSCTSNVVSFDAHQNPIVLMVLLARFGSILGILDSAFSPSAMVLLLYGPLSHACNSIPPCKIKKGKNKKQEEMLFCKIGYIIEIRNKHYLIVTLLLIRQLLFPLIGEFMLLYFYSRYLTLSSNTDVSSASCLRRKLNLKRKLKPRHITEGEGSCVSFLPVCLFMENKAYHGDRTSPLFHFGQ